MSQVVQAFEVRLYREHLEEISFLYEQRLALLQDATLPWATLADTEERIEAHLDALVVGDALALQVSREHLPDADFGELHGVASLFCRQRQAPLLAELLRRLDDHDPACVQAVADALKYELPAEWAPFVEQALMRADHRQTGLLAQVVAYQRLPLAEPLLRIVQAPEHDKLNIIRALRRLRTPEAEAPLLSLGNSGDASLQTDAWHALLAVAPDAVPRPLPSLLLPLAGDAASAQALAVATASAPRAEALLALGLAGHLSCLRLLYDQLTNAELADAAALALHWITGAPLQAEVFVPDPVQEDELVGDELDAWQKKQQAPKRADGKPFGGAVTKLSTDAEHWKLWFQQHAASFNPALRYRSGQPITPATLLANLRHPKSHPALRRCAAEELALRYDCPHPFEIDMPVRQQVQVMREIEAWATAQQGRFQPGGWYLASRPI